MKKQVKWKIVLAIIALFVGMNLTNAEIVVGKGAQSIKSQYGNTFYINRVDADGSKPSTQLPGSSAAGHKVYFYNSFKTKNNFQSSNVIGQTFCMSPYKTGPSSFQSYVVSYEVDPTTNRGYDVALIYAYQKLLKEGLLKGGTNANATSREYATILFRWISAHYGKLGSGEDWWSKPNHSSWIKTKNLTTIKKIYTDAIKIGDKVKNKKTTYEKLVNNGTLWGDRWDVNIVSTTEDTTNQTAQVVFTVKAISFTNASDIAWNRFAVSCDHGFSCSKSGNPVISADGKTATFTVNVSNVTAENKKKSLDANIEFGISIKTAFKAQKSGVARMAILQPKNSSQRQNMLVVKDYNSDLNINTTLRVPKEDCQCEQTGDGTYTGYYVYTQNGNVADRFLFSDTTKATQYGCPSSSTCQSPEDTPHVCETPEESGDGNYYCSETSDGLGGEKCDEEQYYEECKCPTWKDECEANPDSDACKEYDEKCTNCTPSINLPNSCSNFDDNKIEGEKTVSVSDINETVSECNSKANQVKSCVIDKQDLTGASFEATTELSNNPYCKVWCKESYTFTLPTARYSQSGGYFTLSSNVTATRDCYVSGREDPSGPIDIDEFKQDLMTIQIEAITKWNIYNKWKAGMETAHIYETEKKANLNKSKEHQWTYTEYYYNEDTKKLNYETVEETEVGTEESFKAKMESALNELNNRTNQLETMINNYNNCITGWTNNMVFDPIIEFTYNEDYINQMNGTLTKVGNESSTETNIYCTGQTDKQYNCLSGSYTDQESAPKQKITRIVCDENNCREENLEISSIKWIQKSKTKTATYQPKNSFSTYTQYGTIKIKDDRCDGNDCLWTRLPDNALPVQLRQKSGVFPFEFTFKNVGQSNTDSSQLGRLIGNDTSVLTSYNKISDTLKCGLTEDKVSASGGYVCYYLNNCDTCDFTCEGDNCEFVDPDPEPECDNGTCTLKCDNCIFDGETTTFKYRTVSLNNLFPNSCDENNTNCREEGYNWNSTTKAQVTKKEIEETGENAYSEPEYSYTLTPTQLQEIRKYNKEVGTYANSTTASGENTIKCDHETFNGIEYSVRCTSTFLDTENSKYFTENKRNTNFTLWTDTEYCSGGTCLSRQDGIGPSWK